MTISFDIDYEDARSLLSLLTHSHIPRISQTAREILAEAVEYAIQLEDTHRDREPK